jgi:hypothetical protein
MRQFFLCALLGTALCSGSAIAATFGKCKFDTATHAFAGSPKDQAACLLRKVKILGNVDEQPALIPPNLTGVIGQPTGVSKDKLRQFIAGLELNEADLGGSLDASLSRGSNNNQNAPFARYFVIHDTSSPNFGNVSTFPSDIDTSNRVNNLDTYKSPSDAKAHVFLNRRGELYVGHKFSVPWRATKLENDVIGTPAKGMFLHIENIQPRRAHPNQADGNAPMPGFSPAQYDRLALLYVVASVRGGAGLVPAFHAAIDQGIPNGHDDPQNFSLDEFDAALGRVLEKVK